MEKAMFAAGCFWGVEAAFYQLEGVHSTAVGYSGGYTDNPNYQAVCAGNTRHAEVIQIEYDPNKISYEKLLEKFWQIHDPTTLNRQGPDIGEQYRSAIFFYTQEQEAAAIKSRDGWQPKLTRKIVTEIKLAKEFYRAEEYHQKYFLRHNISCHI